MLCEGVERGTLPLGVAIVRCGAGRLPLPGQQTEEPKFLALTLTLTYAR